MNPSIRQRRDVFLRAAGLREALTAPITKSSDRRAVLFLALSVLFSAWFAREGMRQAFNGHYVVQDDARQHVFWMERFADPELYPRDLSADYFQTVAPFGYTALYRIIELPGIDPLLLNKLLPLVLGLITTGFCFGLCLRILRVPAAAFISALLLNQSMWMQDDLVSATPRAFLYPLLLAFLYYLSRGSWLMCFAALALEGLFYPSIAFVSIGVLLLRLIVWSDGRIRISNSGRGYVYSGIGLAVFAAVILIYAMKTSSLGPVVSLSEARAMPEFSSTGRMRVFHESFWEYWVSGVNTGMIPIGSLMPFTMCSALLLPLLLRYRKAFPLADQIAPNFKLLPDLVVASVVMFFASHALMFKLYLPNRYTQHTARVVLSIGAGIVLTAALDSVLRFCERPFVGRQLLSAGCVIALGFALVWYPGAPKEFERTHYRTGTEARLYEFFAEQPKDILIASLSREASKIEVFSRRSNFISWESSIPFHKSYYSQVRQRAIDLINAEYSPDLGELRNFIQEYRIDFLVVDRRAFDVSFLASDKWLALYEPATGNAIARLKQGVKPALAEIVAECSTVQSDDFIVVSAACILKTSH